MHGGILAIPSGTLAGGKSRSLLSDTPSRWSVTSRSKRCKSPETGGSLVVVGVGEGRGEGRGRGGLCLRAAPSQACLTRVSASPV